MQRAPAMFRFANVWPVPALLAWLAAWACYVVLWRSGVPAALALLLACGLACALACQGSTRWRRIFIAAGFPLSMLAAGAATDATGAAALWWLTPLLLLLLLYPLASWRDAPLFPTPRDALAGIAELAALPPGARILDAGCGLGAGLIELRRRYPQARIEGIEWSWPLALACRLRCGFARVRRADIWTEDWSAYELVYLFQRPESMARAVAKAKRDLRPGSWLVSLEFPAQGLKPHACFEAVGGKPVWLYHVGGAGRGTAPAAIGASAAVPVSPGAGGAALSVHAPATARCRR